MDRLLISPAELIARSREPSPPVVLDARWSLGGPAGIDEYRLSHVPGARFVDLDRDLAGPPGDGRGRHPLPGMAEFGAAMRRLGVSSASPIVVYDAGGGLSAARAWWLLRYFGHPDVRLLDGGLAAWKAARLPTAAEESVAAPGDFTPTPGALRVVDAAGVERLARNGVLLDARAAERYRGEVEPVDPVAGHIPGALSAPTAANLDADGRFLDRKTLRARFAAMGVTAGSPAVGVYCGSGVTAAHEVLALEVAGVTAALYPGSWSEWVSAPGRPIATGPEPG